MNSVTEAIRKPSIRHLDLSFQNCIFHLCYSPLELDKESFSGMKSLKVLYLKGNLREVRSDFFLSAPGLEELDISSIYLRQIARDAFLPLTGLKRLTCTQCWSLEAVEPELWSPLEALEYLDLSYSPHSLISTK